MDEAAINAEVERRIAALMAQRAEQDPALQARIDEDKRRKDQALMQMGAAAGRERMLEREFRSGNGFDRQSHLSSASAIQAAALSIAEEIEANG